MLRQASTRPAVTGLSISRRRAVRLTGAALGFTVLLASCQSYVGQRLEGVILEALPRVVGPADRYDAVVHGASADLSHFDQVLAVGVRVRRPSTPVIERIQLDLLDVTVDRNARQITSIGKANVSVTLSASDLAAYLGQQPWMADPVVRMVEPADAVISGRLRIPGLSLGPGLSPALMGEFRGHLETRDSQLWLGIDSLRLGGREAPAFARQLIQQGINPLFDVASYAVPSRIDSARVENGAIVVTASGSQITLTKGSRQAQEKSRGRE